VDQNGNDVDAAAAALVGTGGRIDVPFAHVSKALEWLMTNDQSEYTIWVFPGRYSEIGPWVFKSSTTGTGNLEGTTIKLNGGCTINFPANMAAADGSIRMYQPGWFSIIGDAPSKGYLGAFTGPFGGAKIVTSHNQISGVPSPQLYIGDGSTSLGGTDNGAGDEMGIKLHNINFENTSDAQGSNGYSGCNIVFGRHAQMDFEIDNCKFTARDSVNFYATNGYAQGSQPGGGIEPLTNWYFTNTTWMTNFGSGTTASAYPNWVLNEYRNAKRRQRVLLHNSKFIVTGDDYFFGDTAGGSTGAAGNSGHIITNCYNQKTHWWMSWSNNVFYAPNQQITGGSGGLVTWHMWLEMTVVPLANHLDCLGSSISDNQIVGYAAGVGTPVFVDTMGNFAVSLYGNNNPGTIMNYVEA
jgi:hypothetical protein